MRAMLAARDIRSRATPHSGLRASPPCCSAPGEDRPPASAPGMSELTWTPDERVTGEYDPRAAP